MRGLILAIVLTVALPVLGADEAAPQQPATSLEAVLEQPATSLEAVLEQPATSLEPALEEPAPVAEQAQVPAGAVARGTFATAIAEREPVDSITSLGSDRARVYYFNEFVGLSGHRVTHRWEYRGEIMAEVPIAIGGPRWRAYSSKQLDPSWLGEWVVSVVDESGAVLRTDRLVYEAAAAQPETPGTGAEEPAPSEAPASPSPAQP
jgi:hypothetical protein